MEQNISNISIVVPDGKEIVKTVNPDGSIVIKFVDIVGKKENIRSHSWEEFCENHPEANNEYWFGAECDGHIWKTISNNDIIRRKPYLATKEDAEAVLALIQLTRLHDEWVGDWKIDKFKSFWYICTCTIWDNATTITEEKEPTTRFLSFPSKEMAAEFEECFEDLIDKARRFI